MVKDHVLPFAIAAIRKDTSLGTVVNLHQMASCALPAMIHYVPKAGHMHVNAGHAIGRQVTIREIREEACLSRRTGPSGNSSAAICKCR